MLAGGHTNDKPTGEKAEFKMEDMPLHELIAKGLAADARKHNTHAPEWTDKILNDAKKKWQYMKGHMNYDDFPAKVLALLSSHSLFVFIRI